MKIAAIQLCSGPDIAANLDVAEKYIRDAAAQGARFIATPENTDFMMASMKDKVPVTPAQGDHPAITRFSSLAKELSVSLLLGSVAVKVDADKIANRSFLFAPDGSILASYDKIHLFDVDLDTGESHRESQFVQAGRHLALADVEGLKLGMSICYDVRFAYLYRALTQRGAEIITVPAAFTVPTGQAHWETLLRARAIETGSFLIAPAQGGEHAGGRKTFGHSMIIGPWGQVIAAKRDDTPGVLMAEIDAADVAKARAAIPSLKHDRLYE